MTFVTINNFMFVTVSIRVGRDLFDFCFSSGNTFKVLVLIPRGVHYIFLQTPIRSYCVQGVLIKTTTQPHSSFNYCEKLNVKHVKKNYQGNYTHRNELLNRFRQTEQTKYSRGSWNFKINILPKTIREERYAVGKQNKTTFKDEIRFERSRTNVFNETSVMMIGAFEFDSD